MLNTSSNGSNVIVHQYDLSPYSQKVIKMMALKGIHWVSVAMPYFAPKPELTRLTTGYRGTPVLQIGSDIYVDTFRIALEIESRFPTPTLFPFGSRGLSLSMAPAGDAIFEPVLRMAITTLGPTWSPDIVAERRAVYSRIPWDDMPTEYAQNASEIRAWAAVINMQLADGRDYLLGTEPSLADIHAYTHLWSAGTLFAEMPRLLNGFEQLSPWSDRMAALGEGHRTTGDIAQAYASASQSNPVDAVECDPDDPLGLSPGQIVQIEPKSSNRGTSRGVLVALSTTEVVISHEDSELGTLHVHFPRIGYRISVA
jgi:glutathione S-transferase